MTETHSIEQVAQALTDNHGIVLAAARQLGVTPQAVNKRIQESTTLQKAKADARETIVDMAETALVVSVTNKDPWAVQFVLRTLGKKRGYVDRRELVGPEGPDGPEGAPLPIRVQIVPVDYRQGLGPVLTSEDDDPNQP